VEECQGPHGAHQLARHNRCGQHARCPVLAYVSMASSLQRKTVARTCRDDCGHTYQVCKCRWAECDKSGQRVARATIARFVSSAHSMGQLDTRTAYYGTQSLDLLLARACSRVHTNECVCSQTATLTDFSRTHARRCTQLSTTGRSASPLLRSL
jgi:hypothetical protein